MLAISVTLDWRTTLADCAHGRTKDESMSSKLTKATAKRNTPDAARHDMQSESVKEMEHAGFS